MNFLSGYKTYLGGGAAILFGLAGMILHFLGQGGLDYTTGFGVASGGLVAVGLGGKLDKLKGVLELLKK